MSGSFNDQGAPVREGDIIQVTIDGVGEKGDGIARVSGFVVFVPKTKAGQKVKVKMVKVLSKVGFAEVVSNETKTTVEPKPKVKEMPKPEELLPDPEPSPEDSDNFGEEPEDKEEEYM